jgi:hypothetical protein
MTGSQRAGSAWCGAWPRCHRRCAGPASSEIEAQRLGKFRRPARLVVVRPQRHVHLGVGQGEVELVLALLQAVGVRGGHGAADALGQAQVVRQGIDLRLVQVGDRLQVRRAVAVRTKKPRSCSRRFGVPITA